MKISQKVTSVSKYLVLEKDACLLHSKKGREVNLRSLGDKCSVFQGPVLQALTAELALLLSLDSSQFS